MWEHCHHNHPGAGSTNMFTSHRWWTTNEREIMTYKMSNDEVLKLLDAAHAVRTHEATDATTPMSVAAQRIRELVAEIERLENEIKHYRVRLACTQEDLMDAHWRLKLGTRE